MSAGDLQLDYADLAAKVVWHGVDRQEVVVLKPKLLQTGKRPALLCGGCGTLVLPPIETTP